jgi:hypothetical protein
MPDDEVLKAIKDKLTEKLNDTGAPPDAVKQLLALRKEYLEQNEAKRWAIFQRFWWSAFFVTIILAAVVAAVWWLKRE